MKAEKIINKLDQHEDVAAGVAARFYGWLAKRPHLALWLTICWTVVVAVVSYRAGRP